MADEGWVQVQHKKPQQPQHNNKQHLKPTQAGNIRTPVRAARPVDDKGWVQVQAKPHHQHINKKPLPKTNAIINSQAHTPKISSTHATQSVQKGHSSNTKTPDTTTKPSTMNKQTFSIPAPPKSILSYGESNHFDLVRTISPL